jgi:predicted nucleic acid-binding protein
MSLKVYIETTIPSFYFETRQDMENQVRRKWTREWWDKYHAYYNLFTSEAVLFELGRSNYPAPKRAATLEMVGDIAVLPLTDEVVSVANTYRRELVMPKEPSLDSLHLALASCHGCDILLTWNCDHLANANKHGHIKRVNDRLKLATPLLITPIELLKGPL